MSYTQPGAYLKGSLIQNYVMTSTASGGGNTWFLDIATAGQTPVSLSYALGVSAVDGSITEYPITTNGATFQDVVNLTSQRLSGFGAVTILSQSATSVSIQITGNTQFVYVHRVLPLGGTVRVSGRPGVSSTSVAGSCMIPTGLVIGTGYISPITGQVPITGSAMRTAAADVETPPKKETKAIQVAPDATANIPRAFGGVIVGIDRCSCCLKLLRHGTVSIVLAFPINGTLGAGTASYLFVEENTGRFAVAIGANGAAIPVGFCAPYEYIGAISVLSYTPGDLTAVVLI
jgi:hypothetical protein